jgi:hypothetical protein
MSLYQRFGEPITSSRGGPGTTHTATIETIDNDAAASVMTMLDVAGPRPNPGTNITEGLCPAVWCKSTSHA